MKQEADKLFQLIKSMSMSEKRYFKINSLKNGSKTGSNNYIKLFDVMDKQKEYDKKVLKIKLKNEPFVKNLKVIKSYLSDSILNSLNAYYSGKTQQAHGERLLRNIDILFGKNMVDHCYKEIQKAKKIAVKDEEHFILSKIMDYEYRIFSSGLLPQINEQQVTRSFEERNNIQNNIMNIIGYQELFMRLTMNLKRESSMIRESKSMSFVDNLMRHNLLSDPEMALTNEAKMLYYHIHAECFYLKSDLINSFNSLRSVIHLFESTPILLSNNVSKYTSVLSNILMLSMQLNKTNDFYRFQKLMRKVLNDDSLEIEEISRSSHLANSYIMDLGLQITTGDFIKGIKIIDEAKSVLNLEEIQINKATKWTFYFYSSYTFFLSGKYKESLNYLLKIINDSDRELLQDLRSFANIILLIIHYELKNYDLLPYHSRATYRQLLKRNKLFRFERIILNFIRGKLQDIGNQDELIESFKELRTQLVEISKDPYERKAYEYFDFISWIEAKIENRKFADIVMTKSIHKSKKYI